MSQIQANAVIEQLNSTTGLTAEQKSEIAVLVANVPWHSPAEKDSILDMIQTDAPSFKKRRQMQDFMAVHHYLTAGMWDAFKDSTIPSEVKLQGLLSHAMKLGLRTPSEPSLKWLCSLWLWITLDGATLTRMDMVSKGMRLKTVKSVWDNLRRRSPGEPPAVVDKLPVKVVDFLRDYPVLYRAAFPGEASPAEPGIDVEGLRGFDMSYNCRGGLAKLVPLAQSPVRRAAGSQGLPPSGSNGMDVFERMAGMFMQCMSQQFSAVQGVQRGVLSMSTLEDRTRHQPAAPLALLPSGFGCPSVALPPSGSRGPLALMAPEDSVPPKTPSPAKLGTVPVETSPSPVPDPNCPTPDIEDLLTMMQERKGSKGAAKATAATPAATEPVPKAKPPTAAKATASSSSSTPKAVATLKSKATKVGKSKAPAVAAAKPAAKAAAKPAAKGAIAPAKPSAKAKGSPWKPDDGFGCSKCRWAFTGCSQCKSETFGGFRWNSSMKK